MNRKQIEIAVARLLGDLLLDGTVDAATSVAVADSDLVFPEAGLLRGMEFYLHTSAIPTINDLARAIATSALGTIGLIPSLPAAPTLGDGYSIYQKFRHSEYVSAIEESMRRARELYLKDFSATFSIVATQWEYTVPSGFRYVNSIIIIPSLSTSDFDTGNYEPISQPSWFVRVAPNGSRLISFRPGYVDLDGYDDYTAIVIGQRRPVDFTGGAPTQSSEVPESYIIHRAAEILNWRGLIKEVDVSKHIALSREVSKLERALLTGRRANSVEVG